ncbi:MAG: hypothetical protein HC859_07840 [Bacteroidia bacterium]|nr:hypothetical protein [Bacteroidia bacterium]
MNVLAKAVSILFHPLLMASYLLLILYNGLPAALEPIRIEAFNAVLLMIFLVTFFLPVFNLIIFRVFGSIKSLQMPTRRERILPFIFITILYVVITYLFYAKFRINFNDNFLKILLIVDFLVVGATLTTFFMKVSVHSLAICGMLGILVPLNKAMDHHELFYPTIALIVAAGLVMSARLQLQAHTPREVMVGAVLGFSISFVSVFLLF